MVKTFLRAVVCACLFVTPLALLSSPRALGQATNPFFTPPTFPGTGQALSADLNGDGKLDLLFADGTVLLGKGDGTFTSGTSWGGTTATQIALADFNGDGKQDLLVPGTLNQLLVYLGNGDGTFQPAVTTSIGLPATSFVVGDLNGDGKADVLAQVGSTFLTYLGKGNGTFAAVGIASNAVDASIFDSFADFNGDGKADLFVFNQAVLQIGNGDGTFQAPVQLPFGSPAASGLIGDFDGDGKLDIMGFIGTSGSRQVQILFGKGDGTFRPGSVQPFTDAASGDLEVADLNGDGKADLVGTTGSAVQVQIGKGDGTFTPGPFYNAPQGTGNSIVVADFNGDGKKDVSAFNTMLLGNGDGTLQADPVALGSFGYSSVTGDFNGDSHPDIASITSGTNTSVNLNIWLNDGKANLTLANTYPITIPSPETSFGGIVEIGAAIDVNGDGKIDLVGTIWDAGGLKILVLLGNGDGTFGAPILTVVNNLSNHADSAELTVGDVSGDGKPDVLVTNFGSGGGMLNVLLGNGDGTFGPPSSPFVGSAVSNATLGDFNNDKKLDVILGTSGGIGVLLGNGDGTFQPTTYITNTACTTSCSSLLAGDFNGDGNLDLFATTPTGYQVLLGKGDGTFTASAAVTLSAGTFGVSPLIGQVADFNGDAHLDVFGIFPSENAPLGLLLGNGDGTFRTPFSMPVLPSLASPVVLVGDFNGDGRSDVGVTSMNQLVWLFNNGPAAVTPPPAPPDFSVGSGAGGSMETVTAGSTATYPLSLTGSGGFTGNVALTCSVAPVGPVCSVSPSSVTVSGSAAVKATVSVTTTARSGLLPTSVPSDRDSSRRILWIFGAFLAAGAISLFVRTQMRSLSWSLATACMAILLLSASLIGGCGGGSNSSTGSGGSTATGTSAGSYTVTVTAQSGSVVHKTQLTLKVQ